MAGFACIGVIYATSKSALAEPTVVPATESHFPDAADVAEGTDAYWRHKPSWAEPPVEAVARGD